MNVLSDHARAEDGQFLVVGGVEREHAVQFLGKAFRSAHQGYQAVDVMLYRPEVLPAVALTDRLGISLGLEVGLEVGKNWLEGFGFRFPKKTYFRGKTPPKLEIVGDAGYTMLPLWGEVYVPKKSLKKQASFNLDIQLPSF